MNGLKNIFSKKDTLSKKEIRDYSIGQLSEEEKRAIEEKMLDNEFEQEAMEGFESNPNAIEDFNSVEKKINSQIDISGKLWKSHYTIILVTVCILSGAVFTIDQLMDKEKTITKKQTIENPDIESKSQPLVKELSDQDIDKASMLPADEMVDASEIVLSTPITIDNETNNNAFEMESEVEEIIKMKSIEAVKINTTISLNNEPVSISNISVKYIKELLTVNYKELHTEKITTTEFELSGLPASAENKSSETIGDVQTIIKEIFYDDYLLEAMTLFRNNNFKAALKKYKVILEQYPKDLNALFYGALCYYNINQLNSAIAHFNSCIEHKYNTFYEEANWYKAISLFEKKDKSACIEILNKIIQGKGFYTKRAEELMSKMQKEVNN